MTAQLIHKEAITVSSFTTATVPTEISSTVLLGPENLSLRA